MHSIAETTRPVVSIGCRCAVGIKSSFEYKHDPYCEPHDGSQQTRYMASSDDSTRESSKRA
jgi:hypothetical protein